MKIYTKTGDRGKTKLVDCTEVGKNDLRINCYGTVDELNSQIGVCIAHSQTLADSADMQKQLLHIQNYLFNVGSHLACPDPEVKKNLPALSSAEVTRLEQWIDAWDTSLPKLKEFILPGGSLLSAHCHVARTVCRRAERLVVELSQQQPDETEMVIYLNRLSDYLFIIARVALQKAGLAEVTWKKQLEEK